MITVYKITIVGYVTDQDCGTPADWPWGRAQREGTWSNWRRWTGESWQHMEAIVRELGASVSITETLLDAVNEDATNEGTLPGYCGRCIQERLASDVDYGQVFESFRAVSSDDCDGCAKLNIWEDDLTAPAQTDGPETP